MTIAPALNPPLALEIREPFGENLVRQIRDALPQLGVTQGVLFQPGQNDDFPFATQQIQGQFDWDAPPPLEFLFDQTVDVAAPYDRTARQ